MLRFVPVLIHDCEMLAPATDTPFSIMFMKMFIATLNCFDTALVQEVSKRSIPEGL